MSKIPVYQVDLHNLVRVGGLNLGPNIDINTKGGVEMEYDTDAKELTIKINGRRKIIPESNISAYDPDPPKSRIVQTSHPMVASISHAQVDTPGGHVFAGPGHGKKGK